MPDRDSRACRASGRVCAALVAAAAAFGLAACGSSLPAPPRTRTSSSPIPGLKPGENPADQRLTGKRRGGTLTAYTNYGFIALDPGQSYYTLDYAIGYATQRPLFSYRPNDASTVGPDLAAFMPSLANGGISDGGRTVTVHIRTYVHFSPPVDRAVTSKDVAYAIERAANPHVATPYFPAYFGSQAVAPLAGAQSASYRGGPIPGIQTPNASTIVFHMTRPGATLLIQALSLLVSAPVPESFAAPLDRHNPTTYGTDYLVATGPYMLKSDASGRIAGVGYQPGEFATLVRNPNWNPATDFRPAYLDRIGVIIGGSPAVIGERVLDGSDAVELGPPAQSVVDQAYVSDPSQVTFTPGQGDHYVALDNAAGPLRNVDVRRAVWAALDREAIARAYGGPLLAEPMTHFIYPGVIGYAQAGGDAGPQVDFNEHVDGDLMVARKYMRRAGYPGGTYTGKSVIRIVGSVAPGAPAATQLLDDAFRSLGFHTRVAELQQSAMYHECSTPALEVDACPSVGWIRDFGDPQSLLYVTFYGPEVAAGGGNWGQVDDPRIDAAIARASLVIDPAARALAWADVDRQLVDRAVAAPEVFENSANIESRDVAGVDAVWNDGYWDFDFTSLK
jgi:peptide/nickel transport system substrate-binding protein